MYLAILDGKPIPDALEGPLHRAAIEDESRPQPHRHRPPQQPGLEIAPGEQQGDLESMIEQALDEGLLLQPDPPLRPDPPYVPPDPLHPDPPLPPPDSEEEPPDGAGPEQPDGAGPAGHVAAAHDVPWEQRGVPWPPDSASTPWKIAEIYRGRVHIGWGAICGQHNDAGDDGHTKCKIQLVSQKFSPDSKRRRVCQWLLEGAFISNDGADSRSEHVKEKPRNIAEENLMSDEDLVACAMAFYP